MRAQVLGGLTLVRDGSVVAAPAGRVGALLRWFLVHPNETHRHGTLADVLWPHEELGNVASRQRLYVAASRLRRFLASDLRSGGPAGLRLLTEPGGYRLTADADSLDRVAFEALASRALAGEPGLAAVALDAWRDEPYAGFPSTERLDEVRARLVALRGRLTSLVASADATLVTEQFARTKFAVPTLRTAPIAARPRLLELLGAIGDAPLVRVMAPAGFGKSVLLSQWARTQGAPVAWVTLDREDDDPVRFWRAVLEALVLADAVDIAALPVDAAPGSPRFVDALPTALTASAPLGLVLDDAHHLSDEELRRQFAAMLAALPNGVTVAIASRPVASEPFAARLGGSCVRDLRASELRFTDAEVRAVTAPDVAADPAAIDALVAVTEGWPIAVSYLARWEVRIEATDSVAMLHDYVCDEVLAGLPEKMRSFLLLTAALDSLHPALCDAVTGRRDAAAQLRWLRDRQLLVLDDDGTGWYRCHHLVTDVLRRHADDDPSTDVAAAHQRAGRWLQAHGFAERALAHAIAGDDHDTIAAVAGEVLAGALERGEMHSCQRWLRRIDPDALAANREAHDLATLLVAGWLDEESGARWKESRVRHCTGGHDVLAAMVDCHLAYRHGRARDCAALDVAALASVDDYFQRIPNRPAVPEMVIGTLQVSLLSARLLGGMARHDDPDVLDVLETVRDEAPLLAMWLSGECAFAAYVAGDRDAAARRVGQVADGSDSMDDVARTCRGGRLRVAAALLDSDAAADAAVQRRIVQRLNPIAARFRELRWDVELIPVLLAWHVAAHRAGHPVEAAARLAEADVLLGLCSDAPLMHQARERLEQRTGERDVELSEPERLVLAQLEAGLTYDEIAHRLARSAHTVRSHASAIYRKLGVRGRHGLVGRRVPQHR